MGHHGFEGLLFNRTLVTGSYFHYLHHRFVSCNGVFFNGEGTYRTRRTPAA
jgi:hypothetical protein